MFSRAIFLLLFCLCVNPVGAQPPPPEGVVQAPMPRFPPELSGAKAGDGEVVLAVTVNDEGRPLDVVALEATQEAFARAAVQAVQDWVFGSRESDIGRRERDMGNRETGMSSRESNIGSRKSDTWPRREVLQFSFKRSGVITTLSHREAAQDAFKGRIVAALRTVSLEQLDREPERLESPMPAVSKAALRRHGNQPLMVNFVVDQQGRVRVPVLAEVQDRALAEAVLAAVSRWRYSPPVQNGEAVAVEMTRALVLPEKLAVPES